MISPRVSQEKFQKNLEIQKKIGELYGYNLQNIEFEAAKPRQKEKKEKVVINESINPLQVKEKVIEPSERLKQLNKQIEQLEIQKTISKMTGQHESSNLDVPNLINTKIKEYNYLIDHKHLARRKPSKSFFQSSSAKQSELTPQSTSILQKVMLKQKDLNKTNSFAKRFQENRQIIGLYREYSQSMRLNQKQKVKTNSTNIIKVPKLKSNFLQDLKAQVKIKNTESISLRGKKRYEEQLDMSSPFIEGKFIQSSQELNESIRRTRKHNQFMKQKLMSLKFKKEVEEVSQILDQTPKKQENLQIIKTNMSEFSLAYDSWNSKVKESTPDEKEKECQKSYVSQALGKISPRFVKCQGSKFLMKFDTKQAANSMIEGPKYKKKKQEPTMISNIKKVKIPSHLSEEDRMVMGFMIDEQSDSYYWTTCKNEKINLMLKRHNPH